MYKISNISKYLNLQNKTTFGSDCRRFYHPTAPCWVVSSGALWGGTRQRWFVIKNGNAADPPEITPQKEEMEEIKFSLSEGFLPCFIPGPCVV